MTERSKMPEKEFLVIPAIDLMEGKCVRLEQGDSSRKTQYGVDVAEVARDYERLGAKRLHVVDLDGAFSGTPQNLPAIAEIRRVTTMEIEVGGGVRDEDTARKLFDLGINYVVLGTKALEDPAFLRSMLEKYGDRVILGTDARNGYLSTRGWTKTLEVRAKDFLAALASDVKSLTVIYTDISRDGMFTSPNFEALEDLLIVPNIEVIASGGVGSLEDIRRLGTLNNGKLRGVIVGKALYDGRVSLADALAISLSV